MTHLPSVVVLRSECVFVYMEDAERSTQLMTYGKMNLSPEATFQKQTEFMPPELLISVFMLDKQSVSDQTNVANTETQHNRGCLATN